MFVDCLDEFQCKILIFYFFFFLNEHNKSKTKQCGTTRRGEGGAQRWRRWGQATFTKKNLSTVWMVAAAQWLSFWTKKTKQKHTQQHTKKKIVEAII